MHTSMHAYKYTCTIRTCVFAPMCIHTWTHVYMHTCTLEYMPTCMH